MVEPIGIVVVNFGSHALIEANLGSAALSADAALVVVVDNFSSTRERTEIERLVSERGWTLVRAERNLGFGAAMNLGVGTARKLGCASLLMLNPDAVVSADVIAALHEQSRLEPMALISPRIVTSSGAPYFHGSLVNLRNGRIRGVTAADVDSDDDVRRVDGYQQGHERGWLTAACLVAHSELLDRIGGFDEQFFLYWEDVDLSLRAEDAGASLIVRMDLTAVHDEGGTQQARRGRAKSSTYYYYNCRNRLLFARRHLSRRILLRWCLLTPGASWAILLRGGRRQLVESPRPLFAALRGSIAGLLLAVGGLVRPSLPADGERAHAPVSAASGGYGL